MCGIVGYTGTKSAVPILINGLKRLEYRGYDSSGIAVESTDGIIVEKAKGKVVELTDKVALHAEDAPLNVSTLGIAHTRWATHGPPTTENAHPHASNRIALVHNGIIENYKALKAKLEGKGYTFLSQTDTEVLALLVDSHYDGDLLGAVKRALKEVEGTYGIACIAHEEPGTMIVARRGSPIVLGVGDGETIVASDASAIIKHTRQAIYLDDNDIAKIQGGDIDIMSLDSGSVSREQAVIDWSPDAAEKGGYEHYMLKEIYEQPEAIRNTIRGRMDLERGTAMLGGLGLTPREVVDIQRLVIVGCGTSLNAGMVGEFATEDFAGLCAEVATSTGWA